MTKLIVDEIEVLSTNQNVEIKTGDNGTLEVQGDTNDGTLQLNCSAQSHGVKLKAPTSSAGQSSTMVLPDNQIAASKYLKVKSVTGNVGQLEYGDPPVADLSNLNASNLTSGTLPTARYSIPATSGAGLKLISETVVPSDNSVSQLNFTLERDTIYRMVVKNMRFSNYSFPVMYMFNGGTGGSGLNTEFTNVTYNRHSAYSSTWYVSTGGSPIQFNATRYNSVSMNNYGATCIINTGSGINNSQYTYAVSPLPWIRWLGHELGDRDRRCECWANAPDANNTWLGSIRIEPYNSSYYFQQNTRVLLYKYMES